MKISIGFIKELVNYIYIYIYIFFFITIIYTIFLSKRHQYRHKIFKNQAR